MNDSTSSLKSAEKMSYEEYKKIVNQDDIKKFSKNLKPFWWENVPLFGPTAYNIRTRLRASGLDRGLLAKQINVAYLIFTFAFLIYPFCFLTILTPWFSYWINTVAIKRTKKKIEEDEL